MTALLVTMIFGLVFASTSTQAETKENSLSRCEQLALDYSQHPDTLDITRLKQLQFCINQTLAKRETTDPPTMLRGTIIEPLSPSGNTSVPEALDLGSPGKN